MLFSVNFSLNVINCASPFTSKTTFVIDDNFSFATYLIESSFVLNVSKAATEACATCAAIDPNGHAFSRHKSLLRMMYCVKTSSSFFSSSFVVVVADVDIFLKVLFFREYLLKLSLNEAGFDIDDALRVKVCRLEKTKDDDEKKLLATTTVDFESIYRVVF